MSDQPAETALLVADSWLIHDGRVRFLADHRARFLDSCRRVGADADRAEEFWVTAERRLPREPGRWFPRVELTVGGDFRLRVRPAPPISRTLIVWTTDQADPRRR